MAGYTKVITNNKKVFSMLKSLKLNREASILKKEAPYLDKILKNLNCSGTNIIKETKGDRFILRYNKRFNFDIFFKEK